MKKDRRWLKSAIAASVEQSVSLPWQRDAGVKSGAVKAAAVSKPPASTTRQG